MRAHPLQPGRLFCLALLLTLLPFGPGEAARAAGVASPVQAHPAGFVWRRSGAGQATLPLGRLLSAARAFAPVAPVANSRARLYFPSTGHTLSGRFLSYWQAHQGSALLGPPIAESDQEELGDDTGKAYLVQWFANGRLELHPEVKDVRFQVLAGRVGYEFPHRAGLL